MLCGVQIVNGGHLPANVIHEPVSVFDEHGRYIGENLTVAAESEVTASASVDATASASVEAEVKSVRCYGDVQCDICVYKVVPPVNVLSSPSSSFPFIELLWITVCKSAHLKMR